jgi:SAM-dependent methyltransferase
MANPPQQTIDPGMIPELVKMLAQREHPQNWYLMEDILTTTRRYLQEKAPDSWRQGPDRVSRVAANGFDNISRHISIPGKTFLDMGCGRFHPFGSIAYFYLNGIEAGYAIDTQEADVKRSSESLYDLLCDALARPEKWKRSETSYEDFFSRIRKFDLCALRSGDLESGVKNVPLSHFVGDAGGAEFYSKGSIDIVSSQSVLEHCLDFKGVMQSLYDSMTEGGVGYHSIDLVDHRVYSDPEKYNYWSFLCVGELGGQEQICNILRSHEILKIIEEVGFELLVSEPGRQELPDGLIEKLRPEYQSLPIEELQIIGHRIVIRKPEEAASHRSKGLAGIEADAVLRARSVSS